MANECKGSNFSFTKAYNAKANNDNDDWDKPLKQNTNNKSDKKSKRNELSSDEKSDNNGRTKKPTANVTKAVDFDSQR
jgi:hypothetical protein